MTKPLKHLLMNVFYFFEMF